MTAVEAWSALVGAAVLVIVVNGLMAGYRQVFRRPDPYSWLGHATFTAAATVLAVDHVVDQRWWSAAIYAAMTAVNCFTLGARWEERRHPKPEGVIDVRRRLSRSEVREIAKRWRAMHAPTANRPGKGER